MRIKNLIIIIFIILNCTLSQGQIKMDLLRGEWVNTKVIDAKSGLLTDGKYSKNGSYVRFSFPNKTKLAISYTPFNVGLELPISITKNKISFLLNFPFISESEYEVKTLDSLNLVLVTKNQNMDTILYFFKKIFPDQKKLEIIEYKPFIIKKSKTDFDYSFINIIDFNCDEYQHQNSTCKQIGEFNLGSSLKFPKDFPKGVFSKNLKIRIDIDKDGVVYNTKILSSLNEITDNSVIKFMKKTRWNVIRINDLPVCSSIIFNFSIYLE